VLWFSHPGGGCQTTQKGLSVMARYPGAEAVYEVADLFRERCLENHRSLLWPDDEIWTIENIESFWNSCILPTKKTKDGNVFYWDELIKEQPDQVKKLGADASLFIRMYDNTTKSKNKTDRIFKVGPSREFVPPDSETWDLVEAALSHGIGDPTLSLRFGGQQTAIEYPTLLALRLFELQVDVRSYPAVRHIADQILTELDGHAPLFRNISLHLLFPDEIERIASNQHRKKILGAFSAEVQLPPDIDLDEGLLRIRHHLLSEFKLADFDFYDPQFKALWDPPKKLDKPVEETPINNPEGAPDTNEDAPKADPISQLADAVYLDKPFLHEVDDLLRSRLQLIFEGPPGSGKTFVAEKFARWFTGQSVDDDIPLDEHVEIVQFHQSYGYEDFVQGIRPETNSEGQLVYRVRDGIFLDMVARALANPEDRFVLIIDEINRGNLSRIFGELLLLLEYRGQRVRLPYGSGDAAYLTIPENLYLIGTMNTADRSLSQIDYALRRRFYFVRFMPVENGRAEVYENWLARNVGENADRERLRNIFVNLNHGIRRHLGTDDLQVGHSYFMQDGIETDVVFDRVWRRAVRPLLEEYLHHHRRRDEILDDLLAGMPGASGAEAEASANPDAVDPEDV
jgi:MoxR-like ATPase